METLEQLQAVDQETLTPIVRQALGSESATLSDWQVAPLGKGAYRSVYRFVGSATVRGETMPFSLVVKVASPEGREEPAGHRYWKREAMVYQSGLLADLPAGLSAPRCYGVLDPPDGGHWLWLEEIRGAAADPWPVEQYAAVARDLGVFGGAYLTGRPLPEYPWLSRGWYRINMRRADAAMSELPALLDHPFVGPALSGDLFARSLRFWEARERLANAIEQLPQVFCHLDINYRNLFLHNDRGEVKGVAVDWEFAGINAIGADLATVLSTPLLFAVIDPAAANAIEPELFAAYLDGLRSAGWSGRTEDVRLGYTLAMALHLLPLQFEILATGAGNADFREFAEGLMGVPYARQVEQAAGIFAFHLARAEEAQALLGLLQTNS